MQNQAQYSGTTFVATNDWQDIPEGQAIPPGLHIRLNMQTGKKEAKLLDKTESQNSTAVAVYTKPEGGSVEPTKTE